MENTTPPKIVFRSGCINRDMIAFRTKLLGEMKLVSSKDDKQVEEVKTVKPKFRCKYTNDSKAENKIKALVENRTMKKNQAAKRYKKLKHIIAEEVKSNQAPVAVANNESQKKRSTTQSPVLRKRTQTRIISSSDDNDDDSSEKKEKTETTTSESTTPLVGVIPKRGKGRPRKDVTSSVSPIMNPIVKLQLCNYKIPKKPLPVKVSCKKPSTVTQSPAATDTLDVPVSPCSQLRNPPENQHKILQTNIKSSEPVVESSTAETICSITNNKPTGESPAFRSLITTHNHEVERTVDEPMDLDIDMEQDKEYDQCEEMDWEPLILNDQVSAERKKLDMNQNYLGAIENSTSFEDSNPTGHWILVPDTNTLIAHLDFIKSLLNTNVPDYGLCLLYIPQQVLCELDGLKLSSTSNVSSNARRAISFINECLSSRHNRVRGQTLALARQLDGQADNPDDIILASVLQIRTLAQNKPVIFLSGDINLRNKALLEDVTTHSTVEFKNKLIEKNKKAIQGIKDIFYEIFTSAIVSVPGNEAIALKMSWKKLIQHWVKENKLPLSREIEDALVKLTLENVELQDYLDCSSKVMEYLYNRKIISGSRYEKIVDYVNGLKRKYLVLPESALILMEPKKIRMSSINMEDVFHDCYHFIKYDWKTFIARTSDKEESIKKLKGLINVLNDLVTLLKLLLEMDSANHQSLCLRPLHNCLSNITHAKPVHYEKRLGSFVPNVKEIRGVLAKGVTEFQKLLSTFYNMLNNNS